MQTTDSSPSILHQQEQPLKRNDQTLRFSIIEKPKVHQKVNFWLHVRFKDETVDYPLEE